MNTNLETLKGFYKNSTLHLSENGIVYLIPHENEQINNRVAQINAEIKRTTLLMKKYTEEQNMLRECIRKNGDSMGYFQKEKVKKSIREHRAILGGFSAYISILKREKNKLQKSYPKNMKPKRTKEEKLENRRKRIKEHCSKCQNPNFCKSCYVFSERYKYNLEK